MPTSSLTTEDMKAVGGHFDQAIGSVGDCLRQVNSELAVLQASWQGEAAVRFGQAMHDWEQQFDVITGKLAHMRAILGAEQRPPAVGDHPCRYHKSGAELTRCQFAAAFADVILDEVVAVNNGIMAVLHHLESEVERGIAECAGETQVQYWAAKRHWNLAAQKLPECLRRARAAYGEIVREDAGIDSFRDAGTWSASGW